jgi:serine/threonine-protein kinase
VRGRYTALVVPPVESEESRYVSIGLLARGGMGDVELGLRRSGSFKRLVAIKRLRAEHRDDASFRAMFLEEAKIAGMIRHPNVVAVLDVGEDASGPFLVMDYIEGVTAGQVLKKLSKERERLPIQVVLRVIQQVALGLAAAHGLTHEDGSSLGLVHRDVSPQNILLGLDGVARLTDFGIAKALGSNKNTTAGLLKGKVGYMSPEQLRFEHPTQRSDFFALGVVLYELLSGERLYAGADTVSVAQRILGEPTPDIYAVRGDVPTSIVELSFELLAKDPKDRPASAREIARRIGLAIDELVAAEGALELEQFLGSRFTDECTAMRTKTQLIVREWETATTPSPAPSARGPRRAIAAAAVVIAACGAVAVAAFATTGASPARVKVVSAREVAAPPATLEPEREPQLAVEEPVVEEPVVEEPAVEEPAVEEPVAREPTRRRRPAPAMKRDDSFRAIELIRGSR